MNGEQLTQPRKDHTPTRHFGKLDRIRGFPQRAASEAPRQLLAAETITPHATRKF
jgi:hypothetical protein